MSDGIRDGIPAGAELLNQAGAPSHLQPSGKQYLDIREAHEKRSELIEKEMNAREKAASGQPVAPLPVGPGEEVESLSLEYRGMTIVMGRPNVAVVLLANRLLAGEPMESEYVLAVNQSVVRALMYVKSIDGAEVERPVNGAQLQALMNRLGQDRLDLVTQAYGEYFAPPGLNQAKIALVKK